MGDAPHTTDNGRQFEDHVRLEQVQHLYGQLERSTAGMMVAGGIMVFAMWGQVSSTWLLAWMGAIAANQSWRYTLYRKFNRDTPPPDHARHWGNYWAFGAGISGLIWGSSALFMFVPDSPGHQAFLATALIGVTAGALALITMHQASFYAFVTPTLVPITLRMFYEGDRLHVSLALACLTVFATALLFGRDLNRKLTDSIRLRLHSEKLANALDVQKREATAARAEAEAATRAKSQFLAATAHDIGNQTTLLRFDSRGIAAMARTPDDADLVHRHESAVSSLTEMIEQLRQFSEIESGKLLPESRTIHLQPLFDRLLDDFKPVADARTLKLKVLDTNVAVHSDPLLLRRMLWNLVANAIHYTGEGGVLVCARRRGNRVRIEVYDTGPGIAEKDRENVFQEFQRLNQPKGTDRRGMGLGLTIVRGFAHILGHQIELKSTIGRGSRFTIEAHAAMPRAEEAFAGKAPLPDFDLAGRCVVLIDDDTRMLETIGGTLRSWGCDTVVATTTDEALDALGARRPELIVADYALGNQATGIETIDRIRGAFGSVPAFLITATPRADFEQQAAARRLMIVAKPIEPGRLRSLVCGILGEDTGPAA